MEAKREDWARDPFRFIEEDGYFYGRGTADDKAQAAIWVDMLARFKKEGFKPRRTLKMALTCGEESAPFNGARDLAERQRALIDAEFALNEGGWGRMDEKGKRVYLGINAGEKTNQNFRLEVTNPGGHSMRPVKDNAIYHLSAGLMKIGAYDFPVQTTDSSRAFFAKMGPQIGGAMGAAMTALRARIRKMRRRRRGWLPIRPITPCCAPPASPPCWMPAMPPTPCPSAPAPMSIAAFFPASRPIR